MEAEAEPSAVEMIEGLRRGTEHFTDFLWPEPIASLRWSCLSCSELQEAQSAATKRFKQLGIELSIYTSDDFYSELSTQCMARAIRYANDRSKRAFLKTSDLRSLITADERSMLTSIYIENQEHANPNISDVSPETIEAIRATVKKKDLAMLTAFGSSTLAIYLLGTESQSET